MILQSVKTSARRVLANFYHAGWIPCEGYRGKVLILMYHRILPRAEAELRWVQPGMYVTPDSLLLHLRYLKKSFDVLSFDELLQGWTDGSLDGKGRYCLITFDDGWRDNYIHAFPILEGLDVPAAVFLPTSYIGSRRWFWPERLLRVLRSGGADGWIALADSWPIARMGFPPSIAGKAAGRDVADAVIERIKGLPEAETEDLVSGLEEKLGMGPPAERICIDWDEAAEMSRGGISFGSHSSTHRILNRLPVDRAREEIEESWRMLASKDVRAVPVFCYPNGGHDHRIRDLVRESGYLAALTTRFGHEGASGPGDPFALRRVGIHEDVSSTAALFSFHLSGWPRTTGDRRW